MKENHNHFESLGSIVPHAIEAARPVQPYELLSLAFMPREEALKIAERSARQFAEQNGHCSYCDGVGDVHGIDGEWRGYCSCAAGRLLESKPTPRKVWNYRCDQCFCNAPVYQDNNLCFACDHGEDD